MNTSRVATRSAQNTTARSNASVEALAGMQPAPEETGIGEARKEKSRRAAAAGGSMARGIDGEAKHKRKGRPHSHRNPVLSQYACGYRSAVPRSK